MSKILVYCAVSLDGFIAGIDDDLSWLGEPSPDQLKDPGTLDFANFLDQIGSILMGRRTFDIVSGFEGDWPYRSIPVLVATTRPLPDAPATAAGCTGEIIDLCEQGKKLAAGKNVYLDGGSLITQALDSNLVDELILTTIPVFLGQGVPLYQGNQLQRFESEYLGKLGTLMQTRYTRAK